MNRKKFGKRVLTLTLAALMVLGLSACRDTSGGISTDDAKQCVQVEMDTTYKGKFDGFVDFYNNVTTSDARDQYNANVEGEAGYFLYALGVDSLENENESVEASELQIHRANELYKEIYAKSDYTVVSASKQDDGTYAVKVTVRPLDIMHLVLDNMDDYFTDFIAKFDAITDELEEMSDEEFVNWYNNTYAREYYDTLLNLLEEQIPNIGTLEEKSIVIQVVQDEDGFLSISTEDLQNLDRLIIDYNFS